MLQLPLILTGAVLALTRILQNLRLCVTANANSTKAPTNYG